MSIAEVTRRRAAIAAWRERGFAAGKTGHGRFDDERVLELSGPEALKVYHQGVRTGERERRREREGAVA